MEPQVTLMNPDTPNAFAAFYALTPAERVAAAARLIAALRKARRRMLRRVLVSYRLDYRHGYNEGDTKDVESHHHTYEVDRLA